MSYFRFQDQADRVVSDFNARHIELFHWYEYPGLEPWSCHFLAGLSRSEEVVALPALNLCWRLGFVFESVRADDLVKSLCPRYSASVAQDVCLLSETGGVRTPLTQVAVLEELISCLPFFSVVVHSHAGGDYISWDVSLRGEIAHVKHKVNVSEGKREIALLG